jgi:hypothetical protein
MAIGAELRRLERIAAARRTLESERAAELYGLIVDVRDALDRLADALEDSTMPSRIRVSRASNNLPLTPPRGRGSPRAP